MVWLVDYGLKEARMDERIKGHLRIMLQDAHSMCAPTTEGRCHS